MERLKWVFLALLISLSYPSFANEIVHSPVGYWKAMDDSTGKTKRIIKIWRTSDNTLQGKIIKVFSSEMSLCTNCMGEKRNQPLVGMVILSGLRADENQWSKGQIFDPNNGRTYDCSLRVAENGKKLNVLNYLGIPFLGRRETWERVDLMSGR